MTDLDRALKDALVLGLENDATAEHILRIAAPFIDRAFQDQNNRIKRLEAALRLYACNCMNKICGDYLTSFECGYRARKALEGKDD